MADLLVGPVADVEGAVGADFLGDGDEVHVVGAHEIGGVFADVGAAFGVGVVGDEAMAVEVAEEELVAVGGGEEVALVDGEAAVGVAAAEGVGVVVGEAGAGGFVEVDVGAQAAGVVGVVGDGLDVFVGVRVEVLAGLALVAAAGDDVVEVGDDAGGDEPFAMLVVVEAPGVAGAVGEDFEFVADGVVAPDAGVEGLAFGVGGAGFADAAVGEDAVATVEPAVGAPDEGVEGFVGVLGAPAVEEGVGLKREAGDLRKTFV